MSTPNDIASVLKAFDPANLTQLDQVALTKRFDTKYVFHQNLLPEFLALVQDQYWVLTLDNKQLFRYHSTYFDTPDFSCFRMHHAGRLNRYKVRYRSYLDSGQIYLEIKRKNNQSKTIKSRLQLQSLDELVASEARNFVQTHSPFTFDQLKPQLETDFTRITLVNKAFQDRCTIDLNLSSRAKGEQHRFGNLVIAEVKQEKFSWASSFNVAFRKLGVYPAPFSKYCMSIADHYSSLKQNRFLEKQRKIKKINQGYA